jgi:hypothetical protein
MTQVEKLISAFESGKELTAKQIRSQFQIASPTKIVSLIRREHGFPVYLNTRVDTKGRETRKYRLGTPTRSVVAAGYRAMSFGI